MNNGTKQILAPRIFLNVQDFGAVGDGVTKNTQALQAALDACAGNGGGTVVVPPGCYLTGTIFLKSNIELHLPAGTRIVGVVESELYEDFCDPEFDAVAPEGSRKCLIACKNAENISITGSGEINGSGPAFYDTDVPEGVFFRKPARPRPRMVQFFKCRNVFIEGVSFVDSPGWTFWLIECEDVRIHGIRISGCQQMINNDGIDIDSCRRVIIKDSFFKTGDDCLVLRAIRRAPDIPAVCEDVIVSDCILDSRCQGIRIGCPSDDTIRHCSFNNIIFRGVGSGIHCENPLRYLRMNCRGYLNAYDIRFEHFDIECGRFPLKINVEDGIKLRKIDGFFFSDIIIRAKQPICLLGTASSILENITLRNISGTIEADTPILAKYIQNLKLDNFNLTAVTGIPSPFKRIKNDSWETKF
jgi:hypothetical protein